ncbi:MAG: glutathione S-transferase family protein [Opitutales bacterium]
MSTAAAQFPDEQSDFGSFERQEDAFTHWVTADGSSEFPAEAGRYHLYVSLACPWACRILVVRKLKRLEAAIGVTVVDPVRDERGWAFTEGPDPVNGFSFLSEAYKATDPDYQGRVTVPVLWDTQTKRIVSNSDDDLMRMLGRAFDAFGDASLDLTPEDLLPEIDRLNALIYHTVNNGVYQSGFATTQQAYEAAVYPLFDTLDLLEARLGRTRYLFGDRPLETDWRLFVTLIRFDPVYHGHFKCNLRRLKEYPNLWGYTRDLYQIPGIAETVDFDHIKRHYYVTHDDINPTRIVPAGPIEDMHTPHGRG